MRLSRVLFASTHGYLDPSSGAALATRDLLELLAARGVDCRTLSTGVLDFEEETTADAVLAGLGITADRSEAITSWGDPAPVIDVSHHGVRVTLLRTASSRADRSPDLAESRTFVDLGEQVLRRFHSGGQRSGRAHYGLGLALTHDVANRHGGQLRLVAADVGAAFELVLPTLPESTKKQRAP